MVNEQPGCPQRHEEHKGGTRGFTTTARRLTTNTRMNAGFRDNDEKCYSWGRSVLRETLRGRKMDFNYNLNIFRCTIELSLSISIQKFFGFLK